MNSKVGDQQVIVNNTGTQTLSNVNLTLPPAPRIPLDDFESGAISGWATGTGPCNSIEVSTDTPDGSAFSALLKIRSLLGCGGEATPDLRESRT